jgi:hypothetical protein
MSFEDYIVVNDTENKLDKKIQFVAEPGSPPTFIIEDYKVYSADNVVSIDMKKVGQQGWDV